VILSLSLSSMHPLVPFQNTNKKKRKTLSLSFLLFIIDLPLKISKHYKKMGPSKSIILLSSQLVMGVPWPALQVIILQEDGSEQYWVLILKPCMEHVW